jgi:HAD superfamily hydrolase (TIGR01549 family)
MPDDRHASMHVGDQQDTQGIKGMLDKDKVEAVLFDLDGTLMDTDDQAVKALARWLQRLRWPHPHRTARRLIMASETPGNVLMTLVDVLGLDAPLMTFTDRLRRWRGVRTRTDFRIIAGVEEMLTELSRRYRLAVVTTRSMAEAEAFLDQYHLRDLFDALVTRESTWRLKPHPAPIRHAARLLGVPVERCAMVGDTTVDVKAARRAGAWAVAVLCGFGEREELERAGAHVIPEHTSHLSSLL